MARENKTQYAILGFLSFIPMSAYDIRNFIKQSVAHFWAESDGQLYPTLKKLQQEGLVTSKEEKAACIGEKIMYTITDKGQALLNDWLNRKTKNPVFKNEHLLKLFFGRNRTTEQNTRHLKAMLADLEEDKLMFDNIHHKFSQSEWESKKHIHQLLVLNYGVEITNAEIMWVKQSIALLNSIKR